MSNLLRPGVTPAARRRAKVLVLAVVVALIALLADAAFGFSAQWSSLLSVLGVLIVVAVGSAAFAPAMFATQGPPTGLASLAVITFLAVAAVGFLGWLFGWLGWPWAVYSGLLGAGIGALLGYVVMSILNCVINLLGLAAGLGLSAANWSTEGPGIIAKLVGGLFTSLVAALQYVAAAFSAPFKHEPPAPDVLAAGVMLALIAFGVMCLLGTARCGAQVLGGKGSKDDGA